MTDAEKRAIRVLLYCGLRAPDEPELFHLVLKYGWTADQLMVRLKGPPSQAQSEKPPARS